MAVNEPQILAMKEMLADRYEPTVVSKTDLPPGYVQLSVVIGETTGNVLKRLADEDGVNLSEAIRRAISAYELLHRKSRGKRIGQRAT